MNVQWYYMTTSLPLSSNVGFESWKLMVCMYDIWFPMAVAKMYDNKLLIHKSAKWFNEDIVWNNESKHRALLTCTLF